MKLQLLAIPLLVALTMSPLVAAAASGTITFTSPAAGSSFSGTTGYTIAGTITPTPTLPDNVVITVTLNGGSPSPVDEQTVAVQTGGTFSYATNVGTSSAWVTGTYTITAFDSNGATGSETFTYKAAGSSSGTSGPALSVESTTDSVVYAGQAVQIFATAYWNANGSAAKSATWTAAVWGPNGQPSSISWTVSNPVPGAALWTATLPAGTADGVYAADISASEGGNTAWTLTSFQVNSQIASASGLTALGTSISSSISALGKNLTSDVASLNSAIGAVGTAVSTASTSTSSAISSLQSTANTINTNVGNLGTAVTSLTSSVGTISTDVSNLNTTVNSISSGLQSLTSSVGQVQSTLTTVTNGLTSLQSTVGQISTSVGTLSGLSGQMTTLQNSVSSLSSSVSNAQTYILVVAALAVITLVLELAILIRKMS